MKEERTHYHMTLSDRIAIEQGLYDDKCFKEIAARIHKDPTTVSKEVKRVVGTAAMKKDLVDCFYSERCTEHRLCGTDCSAYCKDCTAVDCTNVCRKCKPKKCSKLLKPPYVCNACKKKASCHLEKRYYRAVTAQRMYEKRLVESRQGVNMTKQELTELNDLVYPLLKQNQTVSHIFASHSNEINICRRTLYNYIDAGVLSARNIDLPRKVKYKKRKKEETVQRNDYSYRKDRTYKDFENYLSVHAESEVVEMDTVKGSNQAGKCLLTLMFRSSRFMLIFLLDRCTAAEVVSAFDYLTETLGENLFRKTFPVILTDNGSEFKLSEKLERTSDGKRRTHIFYCDPHTSNQKSRIERNHEYIRYIIPKGRSMYKLTAQNALDMTNHINSVARDTLNGHTPFDMAKMLLNEKVLDALELHPVPADSVCLHPTLLHI